MALFGFGKKKEPKKEPQHQSEDVKLNRRRWIRYDVRGLQTSLGEAMDISRRSIAVAADKKLEIGEKLDIVIGDETFEAQVVAVYKNRVALELASDITQDIIQDALPTLASCKTEPRKDFRFDTLLSDEDVRINRAIVNLMLEIEDPNTTIEKLEQNILAVPKLEELILKRANSIEKARAARIETVRDAIARLGFEEIKLMVYDYINYDLNLTNTALIHFKDFDLFTLMINALFKRFAPLFGFNDIKSEGQSLMGMSYVGAMYLAQESEKLRRHYTDVDALFAYEMRVLEQAELGQDLLALDRYYFLEVLGVFTYIFDGFVLAYMAHQPHYKPVFKMTLSARKLKFSYIAYLAILAMRYILGADKHSGYVLFNRLKRFGYDLGEAKDFLNTIIDEVNHKLRKIGSDKHIKHCQMPTILYSLENYLGSGIYYEYIKTQIEEVDKGHNRIVLGYEDEAYTHFVFEKIINYDEYRFNKLPFAVIDCAAIEDEDLALDQFSSFDMLLIKNLHMLPESLQADFAKLYRDFDGVLFVTFAKSALLDFARPQLYGLIRDDYVEMPSYEHSAIFYMKMVQNALAQLKNFAHGEVCDIAEFKVEAKSFGCIERECIDKL